MYVVPAYLNPYLILVRTRSRRWSRPRRVEVRALLVVLDERLHVGVDTGGRRICRMR
jgi:hypothetical protein